MQVNTTQTNLLPHISTNEGVPEQVYLAVSPTATVATPATVAKEGVSVHHTFFCFLEVDYSLSILGRKNVCFV